VGDAYLRGSLQCRGQHNALYRTNLAKGQTGLSVAFDLPTQTGYDPDHPLALREVGKVGVPISHIGTCASSSPASRSLR
jgi:methylmalonyl-CoA mutase N-terminal domain/subunit